MSLRRIATSLGLSASAVSLALRNSPKIPAETRAKVLREAKRLGYRPDARLKELMSHLRMTGVRKQEACFGVISFYDTPRPWERSLHLKRIFDSMSTRADELGYRIEPIWIRAPGMTYRRIRSILDARGIQGLISFGSPNLAEEFPRELDHYAIVTQGMSIATPLHRVTSHFYSDLTHALDRLRDLGYRRPGLVLGTYEELRSAHAYSSAYFGWCEHVYGTPALVPVLRLENVEEAPFLTWLHTHRPDAIVFVHLYNRIAEMSTVLRRHGIRVPQDLGVAVVSHILEGTDYAGMQQNQKVMGTWAIELLVSRLMNQDFGIPLNPRIEMVESQWLDGKTLRQQARLASGPS